MTTSADALPRPRRRWPKLLGGGAAALVLVASGSGFWLDARLRGSLPVVDGSRPLAGLDSPVRVERDALGVPVVRGKSRVDIARAMGYVHAQERFFQMDLLRRRSAGELAELVGPAALPADREVRVLRLRAVARRAVEAMPPEERALLDAYTAGVAAGLAGLAAPPFEYLVLRTAPAPWRPEDSMLCSLTMYLTLQGELPAQESTLGLMHDVLPPAVDEFLTPKGTEWDAPLEGAPFVQPPLPGPDVVDVRKAMVPAAAPAADAAEPVDMAEAWNDPLGLARRTEDVVYGSNNWAVAGTKTAHGGAILANDMHLGISVPNTWFRASLVYETPAGERRVTGVTLPGAPFVVVGSNGRVAWGFTNSQGDWADLVELESVPGDAWAYRTPDGPRKLERATETIHVKGAPDEALEVQESIWGPVVDTDHEGRRRALAGGPARRRRQRLARAHGGGGLARRGAGPRSRGRHPEPELRGRRRRGPRRLDDHRPHPAALRPRRTAADELADGTRGWDGWLPAAEYPRVVDPPSGRVFSANARIAGGADLDKVGFGGYDLGARQKQIRDDLMAFDKAAEVDMLRVQLDDRALFLERWQKLLLSALTPEAVSRDPKRAEAKRLVATWGGRASVDSAGYRIVRAFRLRVAEDATAPLLAACRQADAKFDYLGLHSNRGHRLWEGPVWALVSQRPAHLLDPRFASWEELLLASLDSVTAELTKDGAALESRTWGERNTTLVQHPLSRAVPQLARLLDMPRQPLPGDSHMPRFQSPEAGASERLAVSPGREAEGYFHMPVGQSGHPRSPHYGDSHAAWANGERTPFLPGKAVNVLTLEPAR
ncbi:MAG: penicillin acylase family protein [Vicinamibacteria bacterium]